jgi:RNA polymerase sigma-70 factor (ECF subfamily)
LWLVRIRSGDESAFAALFRAYYAPLCTYAAAYVGGIDSAEEIVQEVLLAVWDLRRRLRLTTSLRQYLYGAVRNRAVSHTRRAGSDRRLRDALSWDHAIHAAGSDPARDAEDRMRAAEIDTAIRETLAGLSPRRRAVSELRWRYGLPYSDIARRLGMAVKTVEIHLNSAVKVLRRRLTRPADTDI